MGIETAFFSYVTSKAALTALVGTRVYASVAPSSVIYPYVTFRIISDVPEHDMSGAVGLTEVILQVDAWAREVAERQSISETLRLILDGFVGLMGTENLDIRYCMLENRNSFEEPDKQGKNLPVHRASLDFSIWHVESLPTL